MVVLFSYSLVVTNIGLVNLILASDVFLFFFRQFDSALAKRAPEGAVLWQKNSANNSHIIQSANVAINKK